MKLEKCPLNPILKPNPKNAWESLCVLNPAVIYDEDRQEFAMLYRAAGNDEEHRIYLGLATSKDGIHFLGDRRFVEKVVLSRRIEMWDSLFRFRADGTAIHALAVHHQE